MPIPTILLNNDQRIPICDDPLAPPERENPTLRSARSISGSNASPNLVLIPTKIRHLSISAALLTPPSPKEEDTLSFGLFAKLTFSGMAVLYGDLLISPVFLLNQVVKECLLMNDFNQAILSSGSMIVWILIVYSIKYCFYIFRVRNMGEGGILSVCESLPRKAHSVNGKGLDESTHMYLVWIALIASAWSITDLFFLPGISSFAAFDGIIQDNLDSSLPRLLSILSILLIYISQKWGSPVLTEFYSCLTIVWTVTILILGIYHFEYNVFMAIINPLTIFSLLLRESFSSFLKLWGICFLSISGMSILYSEIGTYKRSPISISLLLFIIPSIIVNFIGQISLILRYKTLNIIFFNMVRPDMAIYLVLFSSIVVLVAANATITSIFALCDKAITFGALPSLETKHVMLGGHSKIFIPQVVQIVVLYSIISIFLSPHAEYYLKHIGTGISLEVLFTWIFVLTSKYYERKNEFLIYFLSSFVFLIFDILSFFSQFYKILNGQLISLMAGLLIIIIFISWYSTQKFIEFQIVESEWKISKLRNYCRTANRFDTLGVYFSYADEEIPFILKSMVQIGNSLPKKIVMVTIMAVQIPFVNDEDRIVMRSVDPGLGLFKCTICYGFCERNIPAEAAINIVQRKAKIDCKTIIYYASSFLFLQNEYSANTVIEKLILRLHRTRIWIFEYCYAYAGNPVMQYMIPKEKLFVVNVPYSI
eukprot:NODE_233_length_13658_cov_0.453647.p1 type:complete len:708 gc:universal NODE_233_length_13658_cov_0.453647:8417-6294(-)